MKASLAIYFLLMLTLESHATLFVLSTSDSGGSTSFNAIGHWVTNGTANAATSPPSPGNSYKTASYVLRTPTSSGTFAFLGDSLELDFISGNSSLVYKGSGANDVVTANYIFNGGDIGNGIGNNPTIAGTMNVIANSSTTPNSGRTFIYTATMSGSSAFTNGGYGAGGGTVTYDGNATAFTGPMIVQLGVTVQAYSQTNLGGNPASFNASQFTLNNGTFQPLASMAITNANSGITLGSGNGTFNVGSGLTLTIANPIAGTGNLTNSNSGTLILTASNSYTGATVLNAGTVALKNNGSITETPSISLAAGATLDATRQNADGLILVAGQSLQGAGAIAGNLIFNPTSSFQYAVAPGAGTNGALLVNGNLTLAGTLQLTGFGSLPVGNYTFPLIRYTGSLTNQTLQLGTVPATFIGSIVVDSVNKQINLVATNMPASSNAWMLAAAAGNGQATLTWTAVTGATSYDVKRALSAGGPFINIVNVTGTSYTDAPLLNGVNYYYLIAAVANAVEFTNSAIAAVTPLVTPGTPAMYFGDSSRLNRPFAKDPSVIHFQGRYLLYYSESAGNGYGWSVGIAQSSDLVNWTKVGEFLPGSSGPDASGLAAPACHIINGQVHMFYQSYPGSPTALVCHAVSTNGVDFIRDPTNPIFAPAGSGIWNNGRAIDADYIQFNGQMFLVCATRDPSNTTQELVTASAPIGTNYSQGVWNQIDLNGPAFWPQLPWEGECTEAPSFCVTNNQLYMFYAGNYDNSPQQMGCAVSADGTNWSRLSKLNNQPFLPNGASGAWNSSESGSSDVFIDDDGQTYLFYQGNNDGGNTWYLSVLKLGWNANGPFIKPGVKTMPDLGTLVGTTVSATVSLIYPVNLLSNLTVTATTSNQALLPNAGLVFSGTNASRTLTLTPSPGQSGTALITVTAMDTNGISDSVNFHLNVIPPGPPKFLNVSANNSGLLFFQLQGTPGHTQILQLSFDLINWQNILTNDLPTGIGWFTNVLAATNSSEFWRAMSPP